MSPNHRALVSPLLLLAGCAAPVEIVAHRGASHDAPENTLAAVELAWRLQADAVEIDVRRTADGKIVVIHDEDTKRTTGVEGLVAERTLEDLRALDAGLWKGPRWQGERIPTLEEVLRLERRPPKLLVEVKCGPEVVAQLREAVESWGGPPEGVRIISFYPDVIEASKREMPLVKAYLLAGWKEDKETGRWTPTIDEILSRSRSAGADGLGLQAAKPLDERAAARIREAGLELHVWTVNDPEVAQRMARLGALSITTDRPGFLRRALSEAPASRRAP